MLLSQNGALNDCKAFQGLPDLATSNAKWVPAFEILFEETGEYNGLSQGTNTINIHEYEYIMKMVLCEFRQTDISGQMVFLTRIIKIHWGSEKGGEILCKGWN